MKRVHSSMVRAWSRLKAHAGAPISWVPLVSMAFLPSSAWGQSSWPSYPNNTAISVSSSGNIGIGTASPVYPLQVQGSANNGISIFANQTGGTGTTYGIYSQNGSAAATINYGVYSQAISSAEGLTNIGGYFTAANGSTNYALITGIGNVGIGTTSPQHTLQVAGTIGAEEVLVTSTGADYVFQPGYSLRSLADVAAYITENRHLPEVPSQDELRETGMGLSDMQTKLLAKVEELTMYMIKADERITSLEAQNRDLRARPSQPDGQEHETPRDGNR